MKALTIRQPWASLIAAGVKTIETRSWSTKHRGPLAIHAGKHRGELDDAYLGAFDDGEEGGRYHVQWDIGALYDTQDGWTHRMPLGAVVATCTLADVVPIGGPYSFRTGIFEGDKGDLPDSRVVVRHPATKWSEGSLVIDRPHEDLTDQLPFGDFTPGRYAWLLTDITPCDPAPAKGRQGLWNWEARP